MPRTRYIAAVTILLGLTFHSTVHAAKTIYPDPLRGPLIARAFELFATGDYTLDQLTDTMKDVGLINHATIGG